MNRQVYRIFIISFALLLSFKAYYRVYSFTEIDIQYPFGPDISIWGKAAVMAKYSAPQTVPPAYPELISVLSFDDGLVSGAIRANTLSIIATILGCFLGITWIIRNRIAGILVAATASIMAIYTYPFFPYVYYMQPDIMTMGVFSLCIASIIAVMRFRNRLAALCFGFWIGVAFSTREHGIILLFSSCCLMWWFFRFRSRILIYIFGIQLGGGLGAGAITMPFFHPHGGINGSLTKAQVVLIDIITQKTEENTFQQTVYEKNASSANNFIGFFHNIMMQSIEKSTDFHPQILLMLLGILSLYFYSNAKKRTGIMIFISCSPLLASFFVWTQWRHFLVLLPIMTILGWGGISVLSYRFLRSFNVIPIVGYAAFCIYLLTPYQQISAIQTKENILALQKKYTDEIRLSQELRFLDDGKSLVMGAPIFSILTGMPPISLDGSELLPPTLPKYPNFVYWTYIVTQEPLGSRWELQNKVGKYYLYQSAQPKNIDSNCLKGEWNGPIVENVPQGKSRLRPRKPKSCL